MVTIQESYKKYFADRAFERRDLLKKIVEKYHIKSALYAGSYTHVTPSFFIPRVIYVDSDSKAKKIFSDLKSIIDFVDQHKTYQVDPEIRFFGMSYREPLPVEGQVDFLFSQYAGPISQACKRYLKKGGILVVNNSHADAGVAFLDPDYKLIGVANNRGAEASLSEKNLDAYFVPKKEAKTMDELLKLGKGIGYTRVADNYIFEKVK